MVTSIVEIALPFDVWVLVAKLLTDKRILSKLSQTCKVLQRVCEPLIYTQVAFVRNEKEFEEKLVKALAAYPRLASFTKSFLDPPWVPCLATCISNMHNIEELCLGGAKDGNLYAPYEADHAVFAAINSLSKLASLTITGLDISSLYRLSRTSTNEQETNRLPPVPDLSRLSLLGLNRSTSWGEIYDVLDILLASPDLEFLALSTQEDWTMPRENTWFARLAYTFEVERKDLAIPPLGLKGLHLGIGCLSLHHIGRSPQFGPEPSLLPALTDLTKLEYLRLENGAERDQNGDHYPIWTIDPQFLNSAKDLKSLVVDRFSADILELVRQHTVLNVTNPQQIVLNSLEVSNYFGTMRPIYAEDEIPEFIPGDEEISANLDQSGYHWKQLIIGNWDSGQAKMVETQALLQNYISKCQELEVLHYPAIGANLETTITAVLPVLHKLKILIIPYNPYLETSREDMNTYLSVVTRLFGSSHASHTPGLQYVGIQGHVFTCRYRRTMESLVEEEKCMDVFELCEEDSRRLDISVETSTWSKRMRPNRF